MASRHGVLGQAVPAGGVYTSIYTCPANKHATVRMLVCNQGAVDLFKVALSPNGAAIAAAHFIAFDMPIALNDSLSSSAFTLNAGDVVRVYSSNGNVSFTLTGIEEDG